MNKKEDFPERTVCWQPAMSRLHSSERQGLVVANGGSRLLEEFFNAGRGHRAGIQGVDLERGARSLRRSTGSRGGLVLRDLEESHC